MGPVTAEHEPLWPEGLIPRLAESIRRIGQPRNEQSGKLRDGLGKLGQGPDLPSPTRHRLLVGAWWLAQMVQNHSQGVDIEAKEDAEWARVLNINVIGIARVSRAALPHLRTSDSAAIVNTCSIAATAGLPQRALYSASKGAVVYLASPLSDSVAGTSMAVDSGMQGLRLRPK